MVPPGLGVEEWEQMLKAINWGGPERQVTSASRSTSPGHSTFTIQDLKQSYSVGEELHATIFAKDFSGQPNVFGEVLDHQNGTYSARFILPWVGQASVAVRMIHSSEAVQALKQHRSTDSDRIYFYGFFVGKNSSGARVQEAVVCNIKWAGVVLSPTAQKNCCCEYQDARTGLTWQCHHPKTLPCDALMYHSAGGSINRMTPLEKVLMDR
ncbi:hypothetical protein ACEWY4_001717 [Coilia grayii]|uniref:NXPE family member 3-like n=1 Tax=Coilia grayii TaxID=363190 RepID=A0ABD1KTQ4_9TELE